MANCAWSLHPCERTDVVVYVSVTPNDESVPVTYRGKICHRHGRQVLHDLYCRAQDRASELPQPDTCFACGTPSTEDVLVVLYYEGDFHASFATTRCTACPDDASIVGEALQGFERLPPRQKTAYRSRH